MELGSGVGPLNSGRLRDRRWRQRCAALCPLTCMSGVRRYRSGMYGQAQGQVVFAVQSRASAYSSIVLLSAWWEWWARGHASALISGLQAMWQHVPCISIFSSLLYAVALAPWGLPYFGILDVLIRARGWVCCQELSLSAPLQHILCIAGSLIAERSFDPCMTL